MRSQNDAQRWAQTVRRERFLYNICYGVIAVLFAAMVVVAAGFPR